MVHTKDFCGFPLGNRPARPAQRVDLVVHHVASMWDVVGAVNYFFLAMAMALVEHVPVPVLSRLMNERETAVCRRLRILRDRSGWSQDETARAVGTTRDQLASVELGRNPLRYWLADRICEKLDVCQQWLATGEGPARGHVRLPLEIGREIKPKELFSSAWERRVGHLVKRTVRDAESIKQIIASDPNAPGKIFENRLYYLTHLACDRIPPERYNDYFDGLMAQTSAFIQSLPANLPHRAGGGVEKKSKLDLTEAATSPKLGEVKPCLPKLLERLQSATADTGKMSELANWLGVPLASVSRWLSGKREPGGEITLRLLYWVEQQELQK